MVYIIKSDFTHIFDQLKCMNCEKLAAFLSRSFRGRLFPPRYFYARVFHLPLFDVKIRERGGIAHQKGSFWGWTVL